MTVYFVLFTILRYVRNKASSIGCYVQVFEIICKEIDIK